MNTILSDEDRHLIFMREAIRLSQEGIDGNHGGPFGALIVRDGEVVGSGYNRVPSLSDPSAHAEVTAIRDAGHKLKNPHLEGCVLYTSCQPCPMCLGATLWAHIEKIYYAATEQDAAEIGFDDANFYRRLGFVYTKVEIPMVNLLREEAVTVMQKWFTKQYRIRY